MLRYMPSQLRPQPILKPARRGGSSQVRRPRLPVAAAIRDSWRFILANPGAALTLYLATGALFAALLAVYATIDIRGGVHVGGWRGIAIAQAYILGRIVIRLTFGASELRLFLARAPVQGASKALVNPGPPAAT